MNDTPIENPCNNRKQLTLGQLLILVALVAIPLVCFLNYHSKVVSTHSGYVTPVKNASGFALLWLGAGVLTAGSAITFLCYHRQWIAVGIYGAFVLAPLALIASGYISPDRTINPAVTKNTEAMDVVISATTRFVSNNNQWPKSWADLRPLMADEEFETISSRVDFDFDADLELLAAQKWHEFSGIVPHKPFVNTYRDGLIILLKTLNHPPELQADEDVGR